MRTDLSPFAARLARRFRQHFPVLILLAGITALGLHPVRGAGAGGEPMTASGPVDPAQDDTAPYALPASHRLKFCLNQDWKFERANVAGAEAPDFDDSKWTGVSLPHTFNDVDQFREWRSHNRADVGQEEKERLFEGKVWYRKHFTLDAAWSGRKVFLEFEGVRNTGVFYLNGQPLGQHSNQVGPCGLDVTNQAKFGADNLLAVQVDSNMLAKDPAGYSYNWSAAAFYPTFGGLVANANLYITDKLYQTLPLYSNLGTTGTYVYAENIDTAKRTAQLTIEDQIANDYPDAHGAELVAWVIDRAGKEVWRAQTAVPALDPGTKVVAKVSAPFTGIHFWSPDYPYLYRVYTGLQDGGQILDVVENPLGVRKLSFSAATGLLINGHPIYLKGYAPRTTMEWPLTGIPQDWMTEMDYKLMKEDHANFIRPMHVALRKHQVESADKFGIIMTCPAGNGEGDDPTTPEGNARWEDRLELMRDVSIYYRDDPSVVFWEGSNSGLSAQHMSDMAKVHEQWDPHGGRFIGCRGTDSGTEALKGYEAQMDGIFQTTAIPAWDAEYARAEAPRRVWDNYTPFLNQQGQFVTGGYLAAASKAHVDATAKGDGDGIYEYPNDAFRLNSSEALALNNVQKYYDRYRLSAFVLPMSERLTKGVTVGGAKIIFADSNSHGRMFDMEVDRVSGALDAVRLPKEAYYAMQVAQNDAPQIHILGHWNYPAGTVKKVYVIANTDRVHLATYDPNGALISDYGFGKRDPLQERDVTENHYAFVFPDVAWQAGKIAAEGYNGDEQVASYSITTAGPPVALRLTAVPAPGAWRADGADIAMVDVEAVDAKGERCPTDEARFDFSGTGPGQLLGSFNSGIRYSTYRNFANTECGINRIFVRATRTAGAFTLTATRDGLKGATITLTSVPLPTQNGLGTQWPRRWGYNLGPEPPAVADAAANSAPAHAAPAEAVDPNALLKEFAYTGTDGASLPQPLPPAHIEKNLQNGSQIYVDRPWTFAGLPAYLLGGEYVQAFERDAAEGTSTDTIQFYTNRSVVLYMLVDAANGMPKHENNEVYGWRKLADTVTINGRTMSIYKSVTLPTGTNGYFAANGFGINDHEGSCQYVVCAVAPG